MSITQETSDAAEKLRIVESIGVTLTVGGADVSTEVFCATYAVAAASLRLLSEIAGLSRCFSGADAASWTVQANNGLSYGIKLVKCAGELRLGVHQI